jgi:hypothetical protein
MSEGDMVDSFRARNGRAAREARDTAMAKWSKNAAKRLIRWNVSVPIIQ